MVKNKVVLKERDAWSDLANFIKRRILKNSEMQNSLLKEKLSHDIITVKTDILTAYLCYPTMRRI